MAISIEGGIAKYFREILLLLEHSTKIIDLSTRNNLHLSLPGGFSLLTREAPPPPPSAGLDARPSGPCPVMVRYSPSEYT